MKKVLSFLLAGVMCAVFMAGCGGGEEASKPVEQPTVAAPQPAQATPAPVAVQATPVPAAQQTPAK